MVGNLEAGTIFIDGWTSSTFRSTKQSS